MPDMPTGLVDLLADGVIPQRVILAGHGALLVTLAQLLALAGSKVSVVSDGTVLPSSDPDAARLMQEHLERAGVSFLPERPTIRSADWPLWVLAPLRPYLGGLELEKAGFNLPGRTGTVVDDRLRLKGFRASLLGSIAEPEFGASSSPGMVSYLMTQLLFWKGGAFRAPPAPRIAGVSPHLCEIGLSEKDAVARYGGNIRLFRMHSREAGQFGSEGLDFLKIVTTRRGAVLGASAFGPAARENMALLSLALGFSIQTGRNPRFAREFDHCVARGRSHACSRAIALA
jgi:pyruvate/2-oxoglutarate dehydrogenase complex dihydrolipoamide dehydrogenase (E3) component